MTKKRKEKVTLSSTPNLTKIEPETKLVSAFKSPAIIISICALSLSIIQACTTIYFNHLQIERTRENNELSVTPKVQLIYNDLPNGDFEVHAKNAGIGPAIVDDIIYVSSNKKKFSVKSLSSNFWPNIFADKKIPDSIIYKNIGYFYLSSGCFISQNESIPLYSISKLGLSDEDYIATRIKDTNTYMYIKYHSIYNIAFSDTLKFGGLTVVSYAR